jgi:hypothetical protein
VVEVELLDELVEVVTLAEDADGGALIPISAPPAVGGLATTAGAETIGSAASVALFEPTPPEIVAVPFAEVLEADGAAPPSSEAPATGSAFSFVYRNDAGIKLMFD